jgi:hypothetical protein
MSSSSSTRRSPRRSARVPKLSEKALSVLQQEAFVAIASLEADAAKVKEGDVIGMVGTADSHTIGTTDPPPNTDDSAVAKEVQMSANASII